jgi:hypothetical protein
VCVCMCGGGVFGYMREVGGSRGGSCGVGDRDVCVVVGEWSVWYEGSV